MGEPKQKLEWITKVDTQKVTDLFFPKVKFSEQAAKKWARDKGYPFISISDLGDQWHIKCRERLATDTYREMDLGSVNAVVGHKDKGPRGYQFVVTEPVKPPMTDDEKLRPKPKKPKEPKKPPKVRKVQAFKGTTEI